MLILVRWARAAKSAADLILVGSSTAPSLYYDLKVH